MMGEGRSFRVAAASRVTSSALFTRAASGLAARGRALPAIALLALVGCGVGDAPDLFGASGVETSGATGATGGGTGGVGGDGAASSGSGAGGASASSSSEASASNSEAASSSSSGGPVTVTALPEGSTYLYWDKGSVAADWAEPGFDDSGWAQGTAPLGYGDPHIVTEVGFGPNFAAKYITTWFRTTFDVKNAASVTGVTLELMQDDGARAFLNGAEAARSNLPGGVISSNTMASMSLQDTEETTFSAFMVDPALLVDGPNVIAIEVHQSGATSSDLGMDARVTLEQLAP